jgi:hypothetical protein
MLILLLGIIILVVIRFKLRNRHDTGEHLSSIIVAEHPYLGWVSGASRVGGEAAALGLETLPVWADGEVSVNINGSVAHLRHFPNMGIDANYQKPKTITQVIE